MVSGSRYPKVRWARYIVAVTGLIVIVMIPAFVVGLILGRIAYLVALSVTAALITFVPTLRRWLRLPALRGWVQKER
jgi:hypothetical protein